jgi:hypothetical protein
MKLTKFPNAVTAEGGQVGNDFRKIKLFRKAKCRGNQLRKVFQLEIFKLILYRSRFHRKKQSFLKNKYRRYLFCKVDGAAYRVLRINIEFPPLENTVFIEK